MRRTTPTAAPPLPVDRRRRGRLLTLCGGGVPGCVGEVLRG